MPNTLNIKPATVWFKSNNVTVNTRRPKAIHWSCEG